MLIKVCLQSTFCQVTLSKINTKAPVVCEDVVFEKNVHILVAKEPRRYSDLQMLHNHSPKT